MQVVILCGGKGTRMGKDLEGLPKALITVGERPILWHIMKYYATFGFNDFLLCLGYKGEDIVRYLRKVKEFKTEFVDTGLNTNTGARIKRISGHIKGDDFFATYADGLSNVDLNKLLAFHRCHRKAATLTAVRPASPFGIVGIDAHSNTVTHFEEKPVLDHWINGGFFVFNKGIFKYLKENDILEKDTFTRVVKDKNLVAYKHNRFWECMDTYKDNLKLNQLWKEGIAPWKIWRAKNG